MWENEKNTLSEDAILPGFRRDEDTKVSQHELLSETVLAVPHSRRSTFFKKSMLTAPQQSAVGAANCIGFTSDMWENEKNTLSEDAILPGFRRDEDTKVSQHELLSETVLAVPHSRRSTFFKKSMLTAPQQSAG
uniref:Breast cancer type 1 susceptibility protein homolog n=1 Tax=Ascaris lumbricoides TaxID=6252 RepID=A0A0M3IAQ4_ASCLU